MTVSRRDFCHQLSALVPASALLAERLALDLADPIRLDSNENPYGPSPSARSAIIRALGDGHRYPGPDVAALVTEIARREGVAPANVMLTVGATEGLQMCARAFTTRDAGLVTAAPSYEAIASATERLGHPVTRVPVRDDGRLDLATMAARAAAGGLAYVCNPNNPTGVSVTAASLRDFVRSVPQATVLVGEAYHEYIDTPGYESMAADAVRNPRILVSRTFSKLYALAGLRIGYLIGAESTLRTLAPLRVNLGANMAALAGATASLLDGDERTRQRRVTREGRIVAQQFFAQRGFRMLPGEANYLFVDIRRDLPAFRALCETRGLLVGRLYAPANTWMRITIGTPDEMQRAFTILEGALA